MKADTERSRHPIPEHLALTAQTAYLALPACTASAGSLFLPTHSRKLQILRGLIRATNDPAPTANSALALSERVILTDASGPTGMATSVTPDKKLASDICATIESISLRTSPSSASMLTDILLAVSSFDSPDNNISRTEDAVRFKRK